jgi:hypothetical protein
MDTNANLTSNTEEELSGIDDDKLVLKLER